MEFQRVTGEVVECPVCFTHSDNMLHCSVCRAGTCSECMTNIAKTVEVNMPVKCPMCMSICTNVFGVDEFRERENWNPILWAPHEPEAVYPTFVPFERMRAVNLSTVVMRTYIDKYLMESIASYGAMIDQQALVVAEFMPFAHNATESVTLPQMLEKLDATEVVVGDSPDWFVKGIGQLALAMVHRYAQRLVVRDGAIEDFVMRDDFMTLANDEMLRLTGYEVDERLSCASLSLATLIRSDGTGERAKRIARDGVLKQVLDNTNKIEMAVAFVQCLYDSNPEKEIVNVSKMVKQLINDLIWVPESEAIENAHPCAISVFEAVGIK